MKKFSRALVSLALVGSVILSSLPFAQAQSPAKSEIPKEVITLAASWGLTVPEAAPVVEETHYGLPEVTDPTTEADAQLVAVTEEQLTREGHVANAEAKAIANEWATQAARGEATFYGDVGKGTTHNEDGTGNIYRLTEQQAQERIAWLSGGVVTAPMDGYGFGVALSRMDGTIYLVEYFLF
ncbi:hypothetical protein QP027_03350 [Corynebacterium breve]|uniref:SCP domain-containing protein n=1 Tax=Corynebacterium breve TaxID=3049799 RepID=A0ABY8VFL5_9CORY|nr:hypothetical protein [Corynebacterium breve]WIM68446.1 hypothetical protein QP027_03350 [Corynebacterium breve]